jgi:hypothetical protein
LRGRVVAVVSGRRRDTLFAELRETGRLEIQASFRHALSALANEPGGTLVLDPADCAPAAVDQLLSAAAAAGAQVVIYTTLDRTGIRSILNIVARTRAVLVLSGVEDERAILRAHLSEVPNLAVASSVLHALAPRMQWLREPIVTAIVELFAGEVIPQDVPTFFSSAKVNRRTGERDIARAGIAAPLGTPPSLEDLEGALTRVPRATLPR